MQKKYITERSINLNHWDLGVILGSALGLPAMVIGGQLANWYDPKVALTSVLIGNLLLWAIGMGIISMGGGKKYHTIRSVMKYLGISMGILISFVLIIAFLSWYAIQIQGAENALTSFYPILKENSKIFGLKIGVLLGISCALLSAWGIKVIKWFCRVSLPLLILFCFYRMGELPGLSLLGEWGVSASGIFLVITSWLPGTINLSTFFRHASTKESKILGLCIMTLLHMFFQTFAVLYSLGEVSSIYSESATPIQSFVATAFIFIAFFSINLVNIYFASVCWETFLKKDPGVLRFIATGLLGTLIYIYLPNFKNSTNIEVFIASLVANLGVILLLRFLVRDIIKPQAFHVGSAEKARAAGCWLIGSTASLIAQFFTVGLATPLSIGVLTTLFSFIVIVFLQETIFSIKELIEFYYASTKS